MFCNITYKKSHKNHRGYFFLEIEKLANQKRVQEAFLDDWKKTLDSVTQEFSTVVKTIKSVDENKINTLSGSSSSSQVQNYII